MTERSRRRFIAYAGSTLLLTGATGRAASQQETTTAPATSPESPPPASSKPHQVKYGMLHNEATCIGCMMCVSACKKANDIPDGVARLEIIQTVNIPKTADTKAIKQYFRKSCQHCENPPCVTVCPTGASYKDAITGIVDVNEKRCVGCRYCIAACPYQVRYIHPVTHAADKCNFCRETNLAQGKPPACVGACPVKALTFGDLNDPESDISVAIKNNPTYRSKVSLGTEPQLYRIPGKWTEIKNA